jgi:hypothetical protein
MIDSVRWETPPFTDRSWPHISSHPDDLHFVGSGLLRSSQNGKYFVGCPHACLHQCFSLGQVSDKERCEEVVCAKGPNRQADGSGSIEIWRIADEGFDLSRQGVAEPASRDHDLARPRSHSSRAASRIADRALSR